tara:strand:+ start:2135 stop:2383 length:249 start_codon:yes stop_codon:yes gene_type:complete
MELYRRKNRRFYSERRSLFCCCCRRKKKKLIVITYHGSRYVEEEWEQLKAKIKEGDVKNRKDADIKYFFKPEVFFGTKTFSC